jgi:hypothetical protein
MQFQFAEFIAEHDISSQDHALISLGICQCTEKKVNIFLQRNIFLYDGCSNVIRSLKSS